MYNDYKIISLENKDYDYLIIATSSVSPLDCVDTIIKQENLNNATILFDLTLINGTNSNRYIQGKCNNGTFKSSDFAVVDKIDQEIKSISTKFFTDNQVVVQHSVIPQTQKYLIKKGMV